MKKRVWLIGILVIVLISYVGADGGFFSEYDVHMYLPDQKAAITWENGKETMIIASSARSDDVSNIAW